MQLVLPGILIASLFVASLASQQPGADTAVDLAKLRAELAAVFDRNPGEAPGEKQAKALTHFLERHAGIDLGPYGYAKALVCYFRRDAHAGAGLLDEHFARYADIEHAEHAAMAGRMYLMALRNQAVLPAAQRIDAAVRATWLQRTAMLFPDLEVLGGIANSLLRDAEDPAAMRLAMVRGVLRNRAEDSAKDRFLTLLYTPPDANERDTVRTMQEAGGRDRDIPGLAEVAIRKPWNIGEPAPVLPVELVLQGDTGLDLTQLRGKVVVLDFFASWSPPCRTGIAELQQLVREAGEGVTLVGVTRLHGRGMDFPAGSKPPHGGRLVSGLDREAELAVNRRFAAALAIEHPLVLTTEAGMNDYGIDLLPTMILLDRDGKLRGRISGRGADSLQQLRALLAQR